MTEELKIDKGVPIPRRESGYGKWVEAFKTMNPGDSFVTKIRYRNSVSTCARRVGINVTVRAISEQEVRVWRVS